MRKIGSKISYFTMIVLTAMGVTPLVNAGPTYVAPPLYFESNKGQTDPSVKFLARGKGYTVFLTSAEAVLSLRPPAGSSQKGPEVVRLKLTGAKADPIIQGQDRMPGQSTYFSGKDANTAKITTEQYAKVSVKQVYPGIDMVYYGKNGELEYDFVVAPGANPKLIHMNFDVSKDLQLDAEGNLILNLQETRLVVNAPVVYQQTGKVRTIIPGKFVLAENNQVTFAIGAYDKSQELVIDPTLTYSTYLGTPVEDRANAIAVDAAGNVYVTGKTAGNSFPGVAGHYQSANGAGAFDVFVIKITVAGAIEWATYLGGSATDIGNSIAVDAVGKVYIVGSTTSANYPTQVPHQLAFVGGTDVFITAIAANGNSLEYSTYLGGSGVDVGLGIAVNSAGDAYVTGGFKSGTFVGTSGAYQINNAGGAGDLVENAFVAKFSSAGVLGYFTYLGGSVVGGTHGNAIAIDGTGNAYVTGQCRDTFPTFPSGVRPLPRAFKLTIGGAQDAFVSKISPTGANLLYSSYLGGSGISEGMGIKVDGTGNVYVTGDTDSGDFPDATTDGITVGFPKVGQTTIVGNFDAFIFKLAMNATGHDDGVYCTFLGGSGLDHVNALALDSYGDAYVTGRTESGDFVSVSPASIQTPIDTVLTGTAEAFVTVIGPAGNTRVLNTFLGGTTDEEGRGIGLDALHNIYVTGWTNSTDFPTAAPLFAAKAGAEDAFVLKMSPTSPPPAVPPTITSVNPTLGAVLGGTTVVLTGTGFANVTSVQFGGVNAFSYTVASSTVITAVSPAHVAGIVDIVVTTTTGASANTVADNFLYTAPLVITLAPTFGSTSGGTSVSITGTGLTGVTLVTFGGTNAFSFIVNSDTLISAVSPTRTAGVVDVIVTNSFGTSPIVNGDQFTFITPALAPTISSVTPASGPVLGGTTVVLTGAGFDGVTSVKFDGVNAFSFTVLSSTVITAISPAHAAGNADIMVTTTLASSNNTVFDNFAYTLIASTAGPTLTVIAPTFGSTSGGTTVALTGTKLTGVTLVTFGGTNAFSFIVNSDTLITAVSPVHAAGLVDVVVSNSFGTSPIVSGDQFTFVTPPSAPTITSLTPTLGTVLGGTTVILTGTGFTNVTSVQFGGVNAFSFTVASATVITAVSPAHASGNVDVVVTTTAGPSPNTAADNFVYTALAGPTLTAIAPTFGATTGGTTVALTGTKLTGVTLVAFGGVRAFSFIVNSDTLITAVSPAQAAGVVNIVVTNALGTSPTVTAARFTYITPAPLILGISPKLGTIYGGTTVAITGTGLTGVTLVTFGGTSAASFVINSDTLITAVTPARAAGTVDVRATNPVGSTPIVPADQFTYFTPSPVVTGLNPNLGATVGGTTVVISGTGFTGVTGAAGVQFGGVNAASYVVNSDIRISAVSPTHAVGTVDIVVRAPVGPSAVTSAGQFTYFFTPVVSGAVVSFEPYVFPSPASKSTATVAYFMASSGGMKARFYNAIGVLVATISETGKSQGANASIFEISDWAPGVYYSFLNVTYDDGASQKYSRVKFVVTR